jgi:amino-acid N-acetyltransferase
MKAMVFNEEVEALLTKSGLSSLDLIGANTVTLFGHEREGRLIGLVGLELYGSDALLRSLAISPVERGTGLGAELVSYAEQQANTSAVRNIYLLTTTAERFFERLGYRSIKRADAPSVITSTAQFSTLCPDSATFMTKRLKGDENSRSH